MTALLQLSEKRLISIGGVRRVYAHPDGSKRCIKIQRENCNRPAETRREVLAWRCLKRRGCKFQRLTQFHGWVETSLGRGVIWDLVLNYDDTLALNLEEALIAKQVSPSASQAELARFKQWILRYRVISTDLNPRNLVCRFDRPGSFTLVQVDGWGNNEFIPVSTVSARLARRKIKRKWQRFEAEVEALFDKYRKAADTDRDILSFEQSRYPKQQAYPARSVA